MRMNHNRSMTARRVRALVSTIAIGAALGAAAGVVAWHLDMLGSGFAGMGNQSTCVPAFGTGGVA